MARAVKFSFGFETFHVRFGISIPKDIKNGWCSNRIAEKMVITTWPTTQELSHITERLIPSASGFRASARALLVFLLHLKAERELLPLTEQGQ